MSMTKEEAEKMVRVRDLTKWGRGDGPWKEQREREYQEAHAALIQALTGGASLAPEPLPAQETRKGG